MDKALHDSLNGFDFRFLSLHLVHQLYKHDVLRLDPVIIEAILLMKQTYQVPYGSFYRGRWPPQLDLVKHHDQEFLWLYNACYVF